jgi:uncharacterized protein (TIGR00730 family)
MYQKSSHRFRTLAFMVALAVFAIGAGVAAPLKVCVFCGSSDLPAPKYAAMATRLGEGIGARHWTLLFGGNETGLMGAVARGTKAKGGKVVGVLAREIQQWEKPYQAADEMLTADTIRERKRMLQERADAFVVLPGGFGTLDELADTFSLAMLDLQKKPLVLVNQDGYYDGLISFIDHAITEKFGREAAKQKLLVARTAEEALALLER